MIAPGMEDTRHDQGARVGQLSVKAWSHGLVAYQSLGVSRFNNQMHQDRFGLVIDLQYLKQNYGQK